MYHERDMLTFEDGGEDGAISLPTLRGRLTHPDHIPAAWPAYRPVSPDACGAQYSASHPFACDLPAGHTGKHEDRHADAPSTVAWGMDA